MGDADLTAPSSAATLAMDPVAIEKMMAACRELADEMADLAAITRAELDVDRFGLGESVPDLVSARHLADRIRRAAVGTGTDQTGSALGLFAAQEAYARELERTLADALAAYRGGDETLADEVVRTD
ncbi:hypothetical protein G4H71_13355 [Rhodococcus triatomae]|uniref:PE family protein n=1 Tax=Rhodococcus triatomae TaxID=300028 RepID=A0A1G8H4X5_9NOCA|nr:hypothetical protein [Rhodococcus triatomae]QNG20206.1 hypothetical protein G4H72_17025 [Rhodococcus triatomae]QNG23879.1 hypothetical protein G4H71_13355 [Rhodococcus triatomae]SDI01663.1 hypothetical protein SAMN05444695_104316 [Rhodococcus triatomae]